MSSYDHLVEAQQLISSCFESLCRLPAWWYHVKIDDNGDDGLPELLGISTNELCKIFITAELVIEIKQKKILSQSKLQSFIERIVSLRGCIEMDFCSISGLKSTYIRFGSFVGVECFTVKNRYKVALIFHKSTIMTHIF